MCWSSTSSSSRAHPCDWYTPPGCVPAASSCGGFCHHGLRRHRRRRSSCPFCSTSAFLAEMDGIPIPNVARIRQQGTVLAAILGRALVPGRSSDMWLGVKASRSRGSPIYYTDYTSHNRVWRPSLCNNFSFVIAFTTFLAILIHLSHTPPWCEPVQGGSKVYLMSCCSRNSWTCCWFQALTTCRISFSPLTKLLPLSERIFSGCPLLLMKRFKALMKGSVSKCGLLGRQGMLKSTPYLLTLLLPRRASNGPSSLLQHKWSVTWKV